jgi:hypothetical protein
VSYRPNFSQNGKELFIIFQRVKNLAALFSDHNQSARLVYLNPVIMVSISVSSSSDVILAFVPCIMIADQRFWALVWV